MVCLKTETKEPQETSFQLSVHQNDPRDEVVTIRGETGTVRFVVIGREGGTEQICFKCSKCLKDSHHGRPGPLASSVPEIRHRSRCGHTYLVPYVRRFPRMAIWFRILRRVRMSPRLLLARL